MAITQIKAAGLTADLIDETKLADDSIDSEHYNDGSIDEQHIANSAVAREKIAADAIDDSKITDNAIGSEHYQDGSIDNVHLADDAVGADELADNAVVNASVASGAAIAGTKIAPDFGSQAVATTSSITGGTLVGAHGRAPTNTQGSTYTLVLGDAGKVVRASGNVTLDQNVFAEGDIVWIYNDTSGDITLIQGSSVTLRLGGDAGTGTRTIAQRGVCTLLNLAADHAVAGGVGVS